MANAVNLFAVYLISDGVVAREIQGEFIVIPTSAEVIGEDDSLFTLNETGRAVWSLINGRRSIQEIIHMLQDEFDVSRDEIEADVCGLFLELKQRKLVREAA